MPLQLSKLVLIYILAICLSIEQLNDVVCFAKMYFSGKYWIFILSDTKLQ